MKKLELNRKEKTLILSSVFVLVLTFSIFASTYLIAQNNAPLVIERKIDLGQSFDTVLEVTVKDKDGNVKDSRLKVGDLVLTNFAEVIRAIISDVESYGNSKGTSSTYFKDTDATGRVIPVRGPTMGNSQNNGLFSSYSSYYPQTLLQVGTGTNSPNVGDTDLQTGVFTKELITADGVYSSGNVTFYGSIPCTSSETITEVGVFKRFYQSGGKYCIILRDTFTGVSVVNTDTIILHYTLMLGEGYTDNFGKILEIFFPRYQTSETSIQLTDYTGNTFSTNCLGSYNDDNHVFDSYLTDGQIACMLIGTGTTSPARNDYSVETQVEDFADSSQSPIYENNINYTTYSLWQVTDDRSITEAGFFLGCEDTGGADKWFMIFRDTFSTQAVSNGREFTVTFKVYYNVI